MYRPVHGFPFIVFHYPPIYYLFVRAISLIVPDMLAAGRLVSGLATLAFVPLVAALVVTGWKDRPARLPAVVWGCAVAMGLCAVCIPNVRNWAVVMRVDMVAIALSLSGLLVGARSRSLGATIAALLLCVAALYTKQTEIAAGISVVIITFIINPRRALVASLVAISTAIVTLILMQFLTNGGFSEHILGNNIAEMKWSIFWLRLGNEARNFLVIILILICSYVVGSRVVSVGRRQFFIEDRSLTCAAMVLTHLLVSTVLLVTVAKEGSNANYFIEWYVIGCVAIGHGLLELSQGTRRQRNVMIGLALVFALFVGLRPLRPMQNWLAQQNLVAQSALVRDIAEASGPVLSENMVAILRAGKTVIMEPAITKQLTATGRWEQGPLLEAIESRRFDFLVVRDDPDDVERWSPEAMAAIQKNYPTIEPSIPGMIQRYPSERAINSNVRS